MKRKAFHTMLSLALGTACAASAGAQTDLDRTPVRSTSPTPPRHGTRSPQRHGAERFQVKAPAGAPNVLIVLIDDIGLRTVQRLRRGHLHANCRAPGRHGSRV